MLRDRYAPTLEKIEARWRDAYGSGLIHDLRAGLAPIQAAADHHLPHHPIVLWTMDVFNEVPRYPAL